MGIPEKEHFVRRQANSMGKLLNAPSGSAF
jgi:hypothetical protein